MTAILPTRHEQPRQSIGIAAATIYRHMPRSGSFNAAWDKIRRVTPSIRFDDFASALTLLYAAGLVDTDPDHTIVSKIV
jgi:hypothetical protein